MRGYGGEERGWGGRVEYEGGEVEGKVWVKEGG